MTLFRLPKDSLVAYCLAGVTTVAFLGLVWWLRPARNFDYTSLKCQSSNQSSALTAQQFTDILMIPERTKIDRILPSRLPPPACNLPELEMRPGAILKRRIYTLAFNSQAVLIVSTENNEYIGYRVRGLKEGAVSVVSDNEINFYQKWHIKIGDSVNGATVIGSLGQVALRLNGKSLVAPFDGHTSQLGDTCERFDGLDVPGYVMQFCGLNTNIKERLINQGDKLGTGNIVLIGVLRRQVNGAWAFVEPSAAAVNAVVK